MNTECFLREGKNRYYTLILTWQPEHDETPNSNRSGCSVNIYQIFPHKKTVDISITKIHLKVSTVFRFNQLDKVIQNFTDVVASYQTTPN